MKHVNRLRKIFKNKEKNETKTRNSKKTKKRNIKGEMKI